MKFIAKNLKTTAYITGGIGLAFDTSIGVKEELSSLKQGDYVLSIEKVKNARSLQQNAYLWELIGQIDLKENGNRTNTEQIYLNILTKAGAKVEFLQGLPEVKPLLEQFFRVVKEVDRRTNDKGVETVVYQCYIGTSKMNTEEMARVIDVAIEYASQLGIDSEYWKELLK